jgi:hypothetical protein
MDVNVKAKNTQTVLQSVTPTWMPTDAEVMTLRIDYPPGNPGIPPHPTSAGPASATCWRAKWSSNYRVSRRE